MEKIQAKTLGPARNNRTTTSQPTTPLEPINPKRTHSPTRHYPYQTRHLPPIKIQKILGYQRGQKPLFFHQTILKRTRRNESPTFTTWMAPYVQLLSSLQPPSMTTNIFTTQNHSLPPKDIDNSNYTN